MVTGIILQSIACSSLAHSPAYSMSILIAELANNSAMGLKYALELRGQLMDKSQKLNLAGSIGMLQGLRRHGIHGNSPQQTRNKKYIELKQKQQQVMRLLTDINTEARILLEESDLVC